MRRFSLIPSQVYLRFAKKATLFKHLLAHLPNILAHELKSDVRREVEKEKRATHNVTPDYGSWPHLVSNIARLLKMKEKETNFGIQSDRR